MASKKALNHPWVKSYPEGLAWEFEPIAKPLYQMLDDRITRKSEAPCLDFMGFKMTYGEVGEKVEALAAGLQELGVGKGVRVGLCLPNTPYYVMAYFAILKTGATIVNMNPLYTEDELEHLLKDSGATLVFTLDMQMMYPKLKHCLKTTSLKKIVVCPMQDILPSLKSVLYRVFKRKDIAQVKNDKFNIFFKDLLKEGAKPKPVVIDADKDTALIQYTGGTTGVPKGAMLSHTNLMSNTEQVYLWRRGAQAQSVEDRFLAVLPFFHVFAMTAAMNLPLRLGAEIIMMPRFELKALLKAFTKSKPTLFAGVPTIYNAINQYKDIDKYDLTSVQFCISGGAALPREVRKTFEKLTGCKLVEGYGLSESSPVLTCNPPHLEGKAGSIGIPIPGTDVQIRDLDHEDKVLGVGETGHIVARGPQVMQAYWGQPEETKKVLQNGWLFTGDVGYMDEEGYIFITDRLKEMINASGYKVYPRMIEEVFYTHPAVAEVAVIGIKHAHKGEAPKAFIAFKEGKSATVDELMEFAKQHLNPIERPVEIEIRKELPKSLIGKLMKKELVAEEKKKNKTDAQSTKE